METSTIKKELHQYIEDTDERLLSLIYRITIADKDRYQVPDWHEKIIEERLVEHEKNLMG